MSRRTASSPALRRLARMIAARGARGGTCFVTGSDTGIGKTWLAGALLRELRQARVPAAGIKALSCGGVADARLLRAASRVRLSPGQVDPVHLPRPLAPAVQRRPAWPEMVRRVRASVRAARAAGV